MPNRKGVVDPISLIGVGILLVALVVGVNVVVNHGSMDLRNWAAESTEEQQALSSQNIANQQAAAKKAADQAHSVEEQQAISKGQQSVNDKNSSSSTNDSTKKNSSSSKNKCNNCTKETSCKAYCKNLESTPSRGCCAKGYVQSCGCHDANHAPAPINNTTTTTTTTTDSTLPGCSSAGVAKCAKQNMGCITVSTGEVCSGSVDGSPLVYTATPLPGPAIEQSQGEAPAATVGMKVNPDTTQLGGTGVCTGSDVYRCNVSDQNCEVVNNSPTCVDKPVTNVFTAVCATGDIMCQEGKYVVCNANHDGWNPTGRTCTPPVTAPNIGGGYIPPNLVVANPQPVNLNNTISDLNAVGSVLMPISGITTKLGIGGLGNVVVGGVQNAVGGINDIGNDINNMTATTRPNNNTFGQNYFAGLYSAADIASNVITLGGASIEDTRKAAMNWAQTNATANANGAPIYDPARIVSAVNAGGTGVGLVSAALSPVINPSTLAGKPVSSIANRVTDTIDNYFGFSDYPATGNFESNPTSPYLTQSDVNIGMSTASRPLQSSNMGTLEDYIQQGANLINEGKYNEAMNHFSPVAGEAAFPELKISFGNTLALNGNLINDPISENTLTTIQNSIAMSAHHETGGYITVPGGTYFLTNHEVSMAPMPAALAREDAIISMEEWVHELQTRYYGAEYMAKHSAEEEAAWYIINNTGIDPSNAFMDRYSRNMLLQP
jgi:hypothetical protein